MATLQVHGLTDPAPERSELGRGLPPGAVEIKAAVRVHAARAGAPAIELSGLQSDDIVEIEFEDGLRLWSRVDDVERDFGLARARGTARGTIAIPSELSIGGPSRGWGGWSIKALKVVGINVEESIGDFIADRVEGLLKPGPGLYLCSETSETTLKPVKSLKGSGPVLVLVHGTASSTSGSFSALWTSGGGAAIRQLFKQYDGRVLALQHETLTKSPIENANVLATRLLELVGNGGEVHLVSHSRGGLVGELLARGMRVGGAPFTPEDLAIFGGAKRARDRKALIELNRTLQQAQLRIARFARVACPARGTTLADRRLDRYFSILVNLASFVPGLKGNPAYDALTTLLAGVLKQRTDPEQLPGLEAMMPGSPLVLMLNRPNVRTEADLHVLGGDIAGTGVFSRLKTLVTDLYYRDDHDLVVNTPAMLGGTERTRPIRYWIDTGSDVTHFHYFNRPESSTRLLAALTEADDGFHTLEVKPFAVTAQDYRKRANVAQPVVFVLPGIMGSELSANQKSIWMDKFALATGGLAKLAMKASGVVPTGVVRSGYADLCEYLSASHEVVPFPYDWRHSVEEGGARLAAALEKKLTQTESQQQPIRLLAHSMGGLVVRAMLATREGQQLWSRIAAHPGARFIMLGTPNGGSHAISALLVGRDTLVKQLALLDLKHDYQGLLETIGQFDGVLNLLPHDGALDLYSTAGWDRLARFDRPSDRGLFSSKVESSKSAGFKWPQPSAAMLTRARRSREVIRASALDASRTIYVAGAAPETACDLVVDESEKPGRRVRVLGTAYGDGRVVWKTGIPTGVRTFYMDVPHGNMASEKEQFPALLDLLTTGTTSKLSTTPPRRRTSVDETFEMRDTTATMVPDEEELVASALGGRRTRERAAEQPRVHVRIVHDDLKNAASPVLVGHYEHDLIVAAEKYLDVRLSNRLSDLQRMELYAGPLETSVVVLNEDEPEGQALHPGAIVAGLGMVGELTPGRLTATLTQALVAYGAERVGRERRRRQRGGDEAVSPIVPVSVTALLVGSSEAGVTMSDSIQALLRAVARANERLGLPVSDATRMAGPATAPGAGQQPLVASIDRLDIFELYEDRAIEAVHAMRALARSTELRHFVLEDLLVPGPDGQRRTRIESGQAWYQRVRVTAKNDGTLQFEALTQLARANESLRPTQRRLVDAFVDQAIGTTGADPALGYTLFELLVPNSFKVYAPDRRRLLLVLNNEAAALPWELLHDRFDKGAPPLAVASGMIRQLLVDSGREKVTRAPDKTALVVGDPIVTDPRFSALPGAAEEATVVAMRLTAAGYAVSSLIGTAAHPMAVLSALHEQPWRILHMAAHGVFQFAPDDGGPAVSGLVLDGGIFLTAAEAEQMRYVPELVFINCCHLGQTRDDRPRFHRLAANLGAQFIQMGARAVIAAGWAVDDAAAKTFAHTFYSEMFEGSPFGEAVARARQHTYDAHVSANTWGAYQCYGDPAFSLVRVTSRGQREAWVAAPEVTVWADQIAHKAATLADTDRRGLLKQLEDGLTMAPAPWLKLPTVCAALASAFAELGEFERALSYGQAILSAEINDAPVRALEQLANLKVRWAGDLTDRQPPDTRRAVRLLNDAESLLQHLLKIGESVERLSLLGGLYKRRAILASGKARISALEAMARWYTLAFERSREQGAGSVYPLGNSLAAELALGWQGRGRAADRQKAAKRLAKGLALLGDRANELQSSPAFFDLSARADHRLLSALSTATLDDRTRPAIEAEYTRAWGRGVTPRHRKSIRDQVAFFDLMARDLKGPGAATRRVHLKKVLEAMDKLS